MADKKISALTASTTPLAGTEVLPIVQGGATVKVAVSDLTAGRAVSAASFAGALNGTVGATTPAAGTFTLGTINSAGYMLKFFAANGTTARGYLYTDGTDMQLDTQDISTPFTILNGGYATVKVGYSNVNLYHSNLVFDAGKGIDFSATPGTGTSELLNDYEEGTFTPVIADASTGGNAGTAEFTFARYTKIGRMVYFNINFININTSGMTALNNIFVRGLPFTSANYCNGFSNFASVGSFTYTGTEIDAQVYAGGTYLRIYEIKTATAQTLLTVAAIASGFGYLYINGSYEV